MPYPDTEIKIRICAVSYTNTRPFVYGLQTSDINPKVDLILETPSTCAQKLIDDEVDLGLVPVAALSRISGYQIISDFCIGADGPVNSVFIFSNKPIQEIKSLRLDQQSRTSNNLAKVLLKNYWNLDPLISDTPDADAFVEIGDRTFGKKDKYPFVYDLADEWKKFTGLPFTFAVWASNKSLPEEFISEFNKALRIGVDNIDQVLKSLDAVPGFDLEDYLKNKLQFNFDAKKKEALEVFLGYMKGLEDAGRS